MLDIQLIRKIVDMMIERDLSEIELRDGDKQVAIKRNLPQLMATTAGGPHGLPGAQAASAAADAGMVTATVDADHGLIPIKSPMVGTFYAAPDPESPAYVTIGSSIAPDTVVCIIEAMKVFNEIKAELAGTVERILVQNEQPVEFGQAMFLIRPA